MGKVKVSKEIDNAIKLYLKYKNKESMLKEKTKADGLVGRDFKILNELSLLDLANVLVNGYDVELSPEEILIKAYKYYQNRESCHEYHKREMQTKSDTMLFVLNTLDIKIKGIND